MSELATTAVPRARTPIDVSLDKALDGMSESLAKAQALTDVLAMMASHCDVESLDEETLSTSLFMLRDILFETKRFMDSVSAAPVRIKAVRQ